jgi:hypothetical protein
MANAAKRIYSTLIGIALCVGAAHVLGGCATVSPPDFLAAGFTPAKVDSLCVLPVADHRIDQSRQLNLDGWVIKEVEKQLKRKGYSYTIRKDRSLVENASRDALETPTPEWISDLGPPGSTYVLMLVLEEASTKLTFGKTGQSEIAGYLFDKSNRQVVWRKKQMERMGGGGLIGMAMPSFALEHDTIVLATRKVMLAFPDRQ